MKHIEQFSVIYSLSARNAFQKYSCGIKVEIDDDAEPTYNHGVILQAVANQHNSFDAAIKQAGVISPDEVVLNCVVRLTK